MKKRKKPIDEFNYEVSYFHTMLDHEGYETADDRYKKLTTKGLLFILFTLERLCTGLFILLGVLFALALK